MRRETRHAITKLDTQISKAEQPRSHLTGLHRKLLEEWDAERVAHLRERRVRFWLGRAVRQVQHLIAKAQRERSPV
jgi:hypothetical protein